MPNDSVKSWGNKLLIGVALVSMNSAVASWYMQSRAQDDLTALKARVSRLESELKAKQPSRRLVTAPAGVSPDKGQTSSSNRRMATAPAVLPLPERKFVPTPAPSAPPATSRPPEAK